MELYIYIGIAVIILVFVIFFILRSRALKGRKWQSIRLREFKEIKRITADGEHDFKKFFTFPYPSNKKDLHRFCHDFKKWLKSEEFFCQCDFQVAELPTGEELHLKYKGKQNLRTVIVVNNDDLTVNVIFNF